MDLDVEGRWIRLLVLVVNVKRPRLWAIENEGKTFRVAKNEVSFKRFTCFLPTYSNMRLNCLRI